MLDKVIIYDIKLKNEYISPLEIRQLMGRAGRTYNQFQQGEAYIFGKNEDNDTIDNYFYGNDNKICSNLNDLDKISFHILPDINTGLVKNVDEIDGWFKKSLSFIQGNEIDKNDIFNYLLEKKCIDNNFNVLFNGYLSINYYYTPNRINILNEKMDFLYQINDFSWVALAWLCSYYSGYKVYHPAYFEFKDNISSKFYLDLDEEFDFFVYYLIFQNRVVKKIGSYIGNTKKDIFRLLSVIKEIAKHKEINIERHLNFLETQLYYNVNARCAELMHNIGIFDKKTVEMLMDLCIKDYNDMISKIDYIKSYADPRTYKMCIDYIKYKGDINNVTSN